MQTHKLDRAKQFMPFAALRGYYDLIRQYERIKEDKKELSESEAEILSSKLLKIAKGMIITVKYYNKDAYDILTGVVSKIDKDYKNLKIIKTEINFDDIIDVTFCNEKFT